MTYGYVVQLCGGTCERKTCFLHGKVARCLHYADGSNRGGYHTTTPIYILIDCMNDKLFEEYCYDIAMVVKGHQWETIKWADAIRRMTNNMNNFGRIPSVYLYLEFCYLLSW